jgi:hypothetical protein
MKTIIPALTGFAVAISCEHTGPGDIQSIVYDPIIAWQIVTDNNHGVSDSDFVVIVPIVANGVSPETLIRLPDGSHRSLGPDGTTMAGEVDALGFLRQRYRSQRERRRHYKGGRANGLRKQVKTLCIVKSKGAARKILNEQGRDSTYVSKVNQAHPKPKRKRS